MNDTITYRMSENFIDTLYEHLDDRFFKKGIDPGRVAVVFEGKRPALFLKQKISARTGKSFVPPVCFSIDEFMGYALKKHRRFAKISKMDAWHMIYGLCASLAPEMLKGRGRFAEFMPWAAEIASFIDLIDTEDIPYDKLTGIEASAGIGYDIPDEINRVLGEIKMLREAFHEKMEKSGTFSRGYIYRTLAEEIKKIEFSEYDTILFSGFFHTQKTVRKIIDHLTERGDAVLIRQDDQKNGPPEGVKRAEIALYAASDIHTQVCAVRQILSGREDLSSTVIVLPDAESMLPLVSELGEKFGEFNVSLGYPLKRSALYALFELVMRAQKNIKSREYYIRDYLAVIGQPLAKNIGFLGDGAVTRVLVHKVEEWLLGAGGRIFVSLPDLEDEEKIFAGASATLKTLGKEVTQKQLKETLVTLHKLFFRGWEDLTTLTGLAEAAGQVVDALMSKGDLGKYSLNIKIAKKIYDILDEFKQAAFAGESFPGKDIFKLFRGAVRNEIMAFKGSPLKGLQVLGLLETRELSFSNVIIIDANDTKLPKLRMHHPLMPHEVTKSLGLDILAKEEEIQQHLFDRMIRYADRVDILYEENTGKERSRFIERLVWEGQQRTGKMDQFPSTRVGFNAEVSRPGTEIPKTSDIVDFLKQRRYSASSVNTYLGCPLQFYYKYVLRLREKETITEDVEGSDIGTFIHELLEEEFTQFVGKRPRIDDAFEKKFFANFEKKFKYTFKTRMRGDSILLEEVMRHRLRSFLDHESDRQVSQICYLEEDTNVDLKFKSGTYKFKYIVDRVDRLEDGEILVLDYKTGLDAKKPKETDKLRELLEKEGLTRENIRDHIKSFQLPIYYYFEKQKYGEVPVNAALYSLRDPGFKLLITKKTDINETMAICLNALEFIFSEITDINTPFKPDKTEDANCKYCPYGAMCR